MSSKTFYECGCMEQGDQSFKCAQHTRQQTQALPSMRQVFPEQLELEARIAALEAERDELLQENGNLQLVLSDVTQERDEARAAVTALEGILNGDDECPGVFPRLDAAEAQVEQLCGDVRAVSEDYTDVSKALAAVAQALEGLTRYRNSEYAPDEIHTEGEWVKWDDLAAIRALIPSGQETKR